jgi:hypothetical protein
MATYQVQTPDGSTVSVEAPEGANERDIIAYAANNYQSFAPPKESALRSVADVPLQFSKGLVDSVESVADFFGANNATSQALKSSSDYIASLLSAQSKKDSEEVARIMADAKGKGVWENVKAGLTAFAQAPIDTLSNAVGSSVPFILAGLAAETGIPQLAAVAGAAGAATRGIKVASAIAGSAGLGAVSGAGSVKGQIYADVKKSLLDKGVDETKAEEVAQQAQAYGGKNLDQILVGAGLGALASSTGTEAGLIKGIGEKVLGRTATEAAEDLGKTAGRRLAEGAAKEGITEFGQQAQQQIASNVARQREGQDVGTFEDVLPQSVLAGVAGAVTGGATDVAVGQGPRNITQEKQQEDADLLDALKVFNQNQKAQGLGPILSVEGASTNQILSFANQFRDRVPVLGTILDSGVQQAAKINLLRKYLSEVQIGENAPQTAVEGRVALPAPPPEGTLVSAPEAISTALKTEVPMTNLAVQQGPEGYRVTTEGGQILTPQVKTEREANIVMEALRREYDARQGQQYQQDVTTYEGESKPVVAEATVKAAREVQTPVTSFPMVDIKDINPDVYNAIREARKGRRLTADATQEELDRVGADQGTMSELVLRQKPVTGGGATIRPEYVQEVIGPRPTEPTQTSRTPAELAQSTEKVPGKIGRKKVMFAPSLAGAEVTQTQPLSQFEKPNMVTLYRSSGMADPSSNYERWTTDRKAAERFGPVNTVSVPQETVQKYSQPYSGAPQTDLLFDRRKKTPGEVAKIMPVSQQGLEQEYSLIEDEARKPKTTEAPVAPAAKKAKREKVVNLLQRQPGEARPAGFQLPPQRDKQGNLVKPKYGQLVPLAKQEAPSAEALAAAKSVINTRIERINKQGKQGEKIAEALRKALDDGELTVEQMSIAFKMADISARLLGSTAAAPHDFKFFSKAVGGRAYGTRNFVEGSVNLATMPGVMTRGRNVAAHEAFHVLQDLFTEYDKAAGRMIRDAFRGAVTVDNIHPDLLRKLNGLTDPDTGKSYADLVREGVGSLYENASPEKRERELQAYVFAALDDARMKGLKVTQFGGAFTRFLNFYAQFKERLANYLRGKGYRNVSDVFENISKGEQQRGLGVETEKSGAKIIQRGQYEPEDLYLINEAQLKPQPLDEASKVAVDEVAKTGQTAGVQANVNTYNKVWDTVREFFNPFAMVTNQQNLFMFRNKYFGKAGESEKLARKTSDIISKATKQDKDAVYTFLTTKGANPNTIADPKVREAALTAKNSIKKIGQELVDNKFMTQESYDKFYDQYLPRVYLYYELTGRGMKTPLGGKSQMEYVMKRDELSKEERDLLGEIKDPAYLTYVAMSRPSRDLAISEYLNNLAVYSEQATGEAPWILRQSMVDWNGHKMTPYALQKEAEDIEKHVLNVAEGQDPKQARLILANINKMRKIAQEGYAALGQVEGKLDTKKYIQMPIDKRYGHLSGAYIQKGIREDLVGTFIPMKVNNQSLMQRVLGDENSSLGKAVSIWKLGKTTLNLPTQVRNFVSNAIALNVFAGVPIHRIPMLMERALSEMHKNSGNWKDAQEYGIQGGTQSSAELKSALDRLRAYNMRNTKDNPLINMFAVARVLGTKVVEGAGDAYQNVESMFKFMAFLHEREQQKYARNPVMISEAVNKANAALFDYTLVNPSIRWLRNAPIGLPFITYYYKALPKLIETAVKNPMRFAPYVAMAMALPAYTMAELGLDDDEMESMRKTLPEQIRNSGSVFFLPYRDEKGNIAYVDFAPYLPWSAFTDPIYKAFKGDTSGALTGAVKPFIINGPAITAINAITTGQDAFTGKPIMDPRDTPNAQMLSLVSYVWNQGMPPMFSVNLNDMDQSGGALPKVYNSMFGDTTGVNRRGLPTPDAVMTAGRLLGFNATPLKADMQRASNMNFMMSEIQKKKAYMSQISKDQSMTQEKRRAKIQQITEQIKEDYQKLQEYGQETALAASTAQRLRNQNEE